MIRLSGISDMNGEEKPTYCLGSTQTLGQRHVEPALRPHELANLAMSPLIRHLWKDCW